MPDPLSPLAAGPRAHASASTGGAAKTPEAAAKQFEAVLVKQFVEVLTRGLFKSEDGGMLTGQADLQRDTITNVLTDTLVDSGSFGVATMMTAQWTRAGRMAAEAPEAPAADSSSGPGPRLEAPDVPRLEMPRRLAPRPEPSRPDVSNRSAAPQPQSADQQADHLNAVEEALRRYSAFSRPTPSEAPPAHDPSSDLP